MIYNTSTFEKYYTKNEKEIKNMLQNDIIESGLNKNLNALKRSIITDLAPKSQYQTGKILVNSNRCSQSLPLGETS